MPLAAKEKNKKNRSDKIQTNFSIVNKPRQPKMEGTPKNHSLNATNYMLLICQMLLVTKKQKGRKNRLLDTNTIFR